MARARAPGAAKGEQAALKSMLTKALDELEGLRAQRAVGEAALSVSAARAQLESERLARDAGEDQQRREQVVAQARGDNFAEQYAAAGAEMRAARLAAHVLVLRQRLARAEERAEDDRAVAAISARRAAAVARMAGKRVARREGALKRLRDQAEGALDTLDSLEAENGRLQVQLAKERGRERATPHREHTEKLEAELADAQAALQAAHKAGAKASKAHRQAMEKLKAQLKEAQAAADNAAAGAAASAAAEAAHRKRAKRGKGRKAPIVEEADEDPVASPAASSDAPSTAPSSGCAGMGNMMSRQLKSSKKPRRTVSIVASKAAMSKGKEELLKAAPAPPEPAPPVRTALRSPMRRSAEMPRNELLTRAPPVPQQAKTPPLARQLAPALASLDAERRAAAAAEREAEGMPPPPARAPLAAMANGPTVAAPRLGGSKGGRGGKGVGAKAPRAPSALGLFKSAFAIPKLRT